MNLRTKVLAAAAVLLLATKSYVPPTLVQAGTLSFAEGTQVSHGFSVCSALILDYHKSSVTAHALPEPDFYGLVNLAYHSQYVHVGNVVGKAVEELKRRGIEPSQSKAYLDVCTLEECVLLMQNLAEYNIKIAEVRLEYDTSRQRSVKFDSRTNRMDVFWTPRLNNF